MTARKVNHLLISVGVDYCLVHLGLRNEDEYGCDNADQGDGETPCQLRPLFYVMDQRKQ